MNSVANWEPEPREVDPALIDPELDDRLSVLRNFTVIDHLDDRSIAALMEITRGGIGEPTS